MTDPDTTAPRPASAAPVGFRPLFIAGTAVAMFWFAALLPDQPWVAAGLAVMVGVAWNLDRISDRTEVVMGWAIGAVGGLAMVRPWWASVGIAGWGRYGLDLAVVFAAMGMAGALASLWIVDPRRSHAAEMGGPAWRIAVTVGAFALVALPQTWRSLPADLLWARSGPSYDRALAMVRAGALRPDADGIARVPPPLGLLAADDEIAVAGRGLPEGMVLFVTERTCSPGASTFRAIAYLPVGPPAAHDSTAGAVRYDTSARLQGAWYSITGSSSYERPPAWMHCLR